MGDRRSKNPPPSWHTLLPWRPLKLGQKLELPVEHVGIFSYLTYFWMDGFMWRAFRSGVDKATLWTCPSVDTAEKNAERLEKMWKRELSDRGSEKASLFSVFLRFCRTRLVLGILVLILSLVLLVLSVAYLELSVLRYSFQRMGELSYGITLVIALFFCDMFQNILFICVFTITHISGARLRCGALLLLYRKLLSLSSLQNKTTGYLVNLFANDSQRIMDGITYLPMLLVAPLLGIGTTAYAVFLMGPWPLIGFVILLFLFPIQGCIGKYMMALREKAMPITDKRVRMMGEFLSNIKFLKMYAWEDPMSDLIRNVRNTEKGILAKVNLSTSLMFAVSSIIVSVATIATIMVYTLTGHDLNPVTAFTYLAVFTSIQGKLMLSTIAVKYISELKVTANRFQEILLMDEPDTSIKSSGEEKTMESDYVIELKGASFSWHEAATNQAEDSSKQNGHLVIKNGAYKGQKSLDMTAEQKLLEVTTASDRSTPRFLHDISLKVERGEVIGVAGPVGSGKSALIMAMLGQMSRQEGDMYVGGRMAYVPQTPWLFHASVRENITFGKTYDEAKYKKVIECCCLQSDLNILPQGDSTEVGERGVTLSGGQKQRISLARAVYSNRDVYLLDDPFSAVDPDVAESLYQKVVQNALLGKTIILVGHEPKFLSACDRIFYMRTGSIVEQGSHDELVDSGGQYGDYYSVLMAADPGGAALNEAVFTSQITISSMDQQEPRPPGPRRQDSQEPRPPGPRRQDSQEPRPPGPRRQDSQEPRPPGPRRQDSQEPRPPGPRRQDSQEPRRRRTSSVRRQKSHDRERVQEEPAEVNLVDEELREMGVIRRGTYHGYVREAGGYFITLAIICLFLLAEGTKVFNYWWLTVWLGDGNGNPNITTIVVNNRTVRSNSIADNPRLGYFNFIYGFTLLVSLLLFILRTYIFVFVVMRAASNIHTLLLNKISHCPMRFFDKTPLGRIMNRFSKDMDELDSQLPPMIEQTLQSILAIVLYIIMIGVIIHWFLVAVVPLCIVFLLLYVIFRVGLRELKRLQNVSVSPLLSHVSATVQGLHSVHAYSMEDSFTSKFNSLLDHNTVTMILFFCCSRWINLRLGLITTAIICFTSLFIILLPDEISPEYAGLAIVYASKLATLFQFFVMSTVEVEARFTSVERIGSYLRDLESEGDPPADHLGPPGAHRGLPPGEQRGRPPGDWPSQGHVRVDKYSMRYREELPLVLKDVSLEIQPGAKIGIVGRTGSGKSSLAAALFRLVDASGGRIELDGIDISRVALGDLRSKMSVIPQDPVLFAGTIRSNLDPFRHHIDMEIWRALEKCHVKDTINCLEKGLDATVLENGENFSSGERQLLCMARVLLRHSKILILDEATASIDSETDSLIQESLKEAFVDSTVLIIAHRLSTVLNSDKVLVMDNGQVVEYDKPSELLSNPDSKFSQLMAVGFDADDGSLDDSLEMLANDVWV